VSLLIAIDGPAAAGKGTLAKRLAAHFALPHLDTGLLYRATGMRVLDAGGHPADVAAATAAARMLRPDDLARPDLRGPAADQAAATVASIPAVRAALLDFQRRFGRERGAVLDGRDIGTIVVPDAAAKLFVTASAEARGRRRWLELRERGLQTDLDEVIALIRERDAQDRDRAAAPLVPAPDALLLDTTALDADATFAAALRMLREARGIVHA
jgi:cytidylate kinase